MISSSYLFLPIELVEKIGKRMGAYILYIRQQSTQHDENAI